MSMRKRLLWAFLKYSGATLSVALAAYVALALSDGVYGGAISQIAPVYGLAFGFVCVGGFRYLPFVFLGAVVPAAFAGGLLASVLSVPLGAAFGAWVGVRVLRWLRATPSMERMRDALAVIFGGILLSTLAGALMESFLVYGALRETLEVGRGDFGEVVFARWLAAGVGSIILTPFVLTWSGRPSFTLDLRQGAEVLVWFATLIGFGIVTFRNWAPTDVLLYPMELAIFPIMAWSAVRFGPRGVTAGVLALALVAALELVLMAGPEGYAISQSPANVWIFVAIVSVTSIVLASVMTELRNRELIIAENESRLRAFTDALPDIAFVLSRDGTIDDVFAANPVIESNHRILSASRIRGKNLDDLFEKRVTEQFRHVIKSALDRNTVRTHEYSLESVDVGTHYFEARVSPMDRGGPRGDRVVWVAYDITSRKASEAAIRRKDRVIHATATANNNLLTVTDFGGAVESALAEIGGALGVDRCFLVELSGDADETFRNAGMRFEWRREGDTPPLFKQIAVSNAPFEEFFPCWEERLAEDGLVRIDGGRARGREGDAQVLSELECRSLLAVPMWMENRLSGFLAVDYHRDNHEWQETEIDALRVLASSLSGLFLIRDREEQLRVARDRANSASTAKGEFLAMMSHEIRTPMNAIVGYTDLLSQTELNDTQAEQAAIIKRSGRALLELINNILDYSKIESRTLELEAREFDLEQVVCEALETVLPKAKEKGLRLDYDIAESVNEGYIGDSQRLRQVLLNLATNAVKFTDEGSVRVRVSLRDEECDATAHALHFRVVDTGCGVPPEKMDLLFQPFTQLDSRSTRKFGGTGLGLVISKRLVERMDGRIWVENEPGEGSVFQFVVRLLRPESLTPSRSPFAREKSVDVELDPGFARHYPLRPLVCEDDEDNRWVIHELLESLGYAPGLAADADEVLPALRENRPDVVLMDVQLPGKSGLDITRMIRSGEVGPDLENQYIIAVTAFAMEHDRERCIEAGMNDYLSKPIDVGLLMEVLRRAHAHHRNGGEGKG